MHHNKYLNVLFQAIGEIQNSEPKDAIQAFYARASVEPFDESALDRLLALLHAAEKYAPWRQDGISATFEREDPGVVLVVLIRAGSVETPFGERLWVSTLLDQIEERVHRIFPADKETSPFHPHIEVNNDGAVQRLTLLPAAKHVRHSSMRPGPLSLSRPSVPLSGNPAEQAQPVRPSRIVSVGERAVTRSDVAPVLPRPPNTGPSPYQHANTMRPTAPAVPLLLSRARKARDDKR